jgi:hypothetical protein
MAATMSSLSGCSAFSVSMISCASLRFFGRTT